MAKVKNEKVKKTVTYEVTITGGPEKHQKINGALLGLHLKPFKDVTIHSVTDKKGNETVEKITIISDKRKKVKSLYAKLYKNYNVEIKVLEIVTEKEEPKKK